MRVLVVEDEPLLASTLSMGLRAEGFVVVGVATGVDGLWQATENDFDVIVLDIMLPGLNGYEVLRRMRARDGLDAGADADRQGRRVRPDRRLRPRRRRLPDQAVLVHRAGRRLAGAGRRGAPQRPAVLTAGTLSLDPARRVVERDDAQISLTPREYGLLEFLMRNKDTVVTKTEILQNVWDAHYERCRQRRRGVRRLRAAQDRHPVRHQHH